MEAQNAEVVAIECALEADDRPTFLRCWDENVLDSRVVKRLMAAVEGARVFVNGEELFQLSRAKARKLAYRWRGNRRGRRITAWLDRCKLSPGVKFESPVECHIKKK